MSFPTLPARVLGATLRLQTLPACPAIRLHLVDEATDLDACYREAWNVDEVPMWAFCWGSGGALASYILAHPDLVRGRRVLDFGCGSGVVAVAAAMAGAHAIALDSDERALDAAEVNAAENGVRIARTTTLVDADLILAADVFYERPARDFLLSLAEQRRPMIVADALRPGTLPPPVTAFAELPSRAFPDVDPPMDRTYLFALGGATPPSE